MNETYLEPEERCYPSGSMYAGRKAKARCADGKIRTCNVGIPDSAWTIPARVKAFGRSIKGYVTFDNETQEYVFKEQWEYTRLFWRHTAIRVSEQYLRPLLVDQGPVVCQESSHHPTQIARPGSWLVYGDDNRQGRMLGTVIDTYDNEKDDLYGRLLVLECNGSTAYPRLVDPNNVKQVQEPSPGLWHLIASMPVDAETLPRIIKANGDCLFSERYVDKAQTAIAGGGNK